MLMKASNSHSCVGSNTHALHKHILHQSISRHPIPLFYLLSLLTVTSNYHEFSLLLALFLRGLQSCFRLHHVCATQKFGFIFSYGSCLTFLKLYHRAVDLSKNINSERISGRHSPGLRHSRHLCGICLR